MRPTTVSPAAPPARRFRGGVTSRLVAAATLALVASVLVLVSPAAAESTVITARVVDANPAYGEVVRVKGRVTGRKPGSRVHLHLVGNNDAFTRVATTTLGRYGRYSFTWQPPLVEARSMQYVMQVVAPRTRRKAAAVSDYVFVVAQGVLFDPQTLRAKYLDIVNDARAEAGVAPLVMVDQYNTIADAVAKETYDNGGVLPQDVYDRFPSNIAALGVCTAADVSFTGYAFSPVDFDLRPEAVYLAVGIYEQPNGKATTITYPLAENPSGN